MIRLFNHYLSVRTLLLTAIEAVVLFQSVVLGFQIRMSACPWPRRVSSR